ncbi:Uncharacterised protein [Vibrio cholerae]|nr:Uncharacterised protein [Vibrio cholerae]CSC42691.1 Uncharacterised protein [Vibrio cholerae]
MGKGWAAGNDVRWQVLHKEHAFSGTVNVVSAGDQNHERGGRTDHQGINVDRERLYQTLLRRVFYTGCRCGVWTSTLTCFVRVNPTFYPPTNRRTYAGHR